MVADKEFYYSTYHGKLSEADVEGCLARAEYMLHSLTLDRLQDGAWQQDETLAKCVRMAHCALADAQHAQDTAVLAGGKVTIRQLRAPLPAYRRPIYAHPQRAAVPGGERMLTPNASCTLYLQTGPYRFRRIFCPSVFWQGDADGTSVIIPEDLPEQYKGEKREHDFIVRGERLGEVTDTESKKALLADKPLTIKSLVHCAFGGLPHCEVTTE